MPELPEVETIRQELAESLVGLALEGIRVNDPAALTGHRQKAHPVEKTWGRLSSLAGRTLVRVERLGKFLILWFPKGDGILMSLRMTGQLLLGSPSPGARVILSFNGGRQALNFMDRRRLGEIRPVTAREAQLLRRRMGPDALTDLGPGTLKALFCGRRLKVHSALTNQTLLAGVGNIYATEALYRAGIRPSRTGHSLKHQEILKLSGAIQGVLRMGIRHGGYTFDSYRDIFGRKGQAQRHLRVYGHPGEECPSCQSRLRSLRITGRGVTYCPACQH